MRKIAAILLAVAILVLTGCCGEQLGKECQAPASSTILPSHTGSTKDPDDTDPGEESPEFFETKPVSQTDPTNGSEEGSTTPVQSDPTRPPQTDPTNGSDGPSLPTEPIATTPPTGPKPTEPPPITIPEQTDPPVETQPPVTQPPTTEPEETKPQPTGPEETTPAVNEITYEYKRQVAVYAAQYINEYRIAAGAPACTVLPGMTLVAEYRADQLTYNYAHDTADKREALAYYEYGRWVDATIVGLDPSASYYEADTSEAICAGFEGKTAEEMGKYIADLCRNSSSHWSYIGSSKNLYIGIGVAYRAGTAYGWYGCIMVGRTNYG